MIKQRCVLTRAERIAKMMENGTFADGRSPFGLPKTRVQKIVLKKKVKKEAAEGAEAARGRRPARRRHRRQPRRQPPRPPAGRSNWLGLANGRHQRGW